MYFSLNDCDVVTDCDAVTELLCAQKNHLRLRKHKVYLVNSK